MISVKKINSFHIIRLSVSGFKCFADKATFDFGDITYITAANGKGKSSIADAITYVFMGTPFFGGNGLDRLQNANTRELEVGVDFIDDTGTAHNLTRSRKNGTTTITFDSFDVRQTDLNTMLGEKEIFLSIFNPLYFIDVLGESGKKVLEKLIPMISHENVLATMSERSRELLRDESLISPETYVKNRRAEIKELEMSLVRYNVRQELSEQGSLSDAIRYIADNHKCPTCSTVMTFEETDEVVSDLQRRLSATDDRLSMLIVETEAEIDRLKTLVSEAISYAAVRAELMLSGLKMNRAKIVLTEIIKSTGEVKDCFRFSYGGRDYRCLSLSEKIKAGLEVSELIKRLSGRNYPIFIDNGESICAIDNVRPSGQVIYSRVVRGEDLKVTYKNNS